MLRTLRNHDLALSAVKGRTAARRHHRATRGMIGSLPNSGLPFRRWVLGVRHAQWGRYQLRDDLAEAGRRDGALDHTVAAEAEWSGLARTGGGSWARRRSAVLVAG